MLLTDKQKNEFIEVLYSLIDNWENEIVEFKEANNDFDKNKIGQYFSAISNEANLKGIQYGWLVFGVKNNGREITGTKYRDNDGLEVLKREIADGTTGNISFIDIVEVYPIVNGEEKRVIMFQIPAAVTAIPTAWRGHYYGRNGESLGPLSIEEQDRIRGQENKDWSKQIIDEASINYLDKNAILIARELYKEKMNKIHISEEVDEMSDAEFLTKIKLIINGKVTNAAMILLGNKDYDYVFNSPPQIMWRLYGADGSDKDYEIFTIPFISVVDKVFTKIRNLTYRYMPNQMTLFPTETQQYDPWMLRELINNCIVHSDYRANGRIYVNEFEDEIKLTNPGTFLPGNIEAILQPSYNPPFYRNQLLAQTMVNLNMIDTAAMGIRKVFRIQKDKFFPLPDYDLSVKNQVSVIVYGKVIDMNYSRVLYDNPKLGLSEIYLIDRVQKKKKISKEAVKHLRELGIVEGRYPNIYLSFNVAKSMGKEAQYIKNKAFDNNYYKKLIVEYIEKFGCASRNDIRELLKEKLPSVLSDKQKEDRIKNLLQSLKNKGIIKRDISNSKMAKWCIDDLSKFNK